MATVYLAIQEEFNRQVCLKVIADDDNDPKFRQRFHEEADIAGSLTHPNIITIYDVGQYKHYHYIAMEYLASGSLDKRISQGLSIAEVLKITSEVASALAYSHQRGYIHRDVKPDNILFRKAGEVVLTDFGIAKAYNLESKKTATGQVLGTPYYMSPEQAQAKEIDARADIYSLGIVLYEMLTGTTPFRAEDAVTVALKHIKQPVPKLPRKLRKLQPLLDKMLAKNPKQRFQAADEVYQACQQLIGKLQKRKGFTDKIHYLQRASHDSATVMQVKTSSGGRSAIAIAAGVLLLVAAGFAEYQYHWFSKQLSGLKTHTQQLQQWADTLLENNAAVTEAQAEAVNMTQEAEPLEPVAGQKPSSLPLTVHTTPANAQVRINNIKQAYKPGMRLSPGTYQLQISSPGYLTLTTQVQLQNKQPVAFSLKAKEVGETHQDRINETTLAPLMLFLPAARGKPIALSATEVTNEDYLHYLKDTGQKRFDVKPEELKHPVAEISFAEAQAYTQWLSKKTGHHYRLPTEQEWQMAAQAGSKSDYWWGKADAEGRANCGRGCDSDWVKLFSSSSAPVGSYAANAWGFYDTAGNVAEWISSCADDSCEHNKVKGGSFKTSSADMAISAYDDFSPTKQRKDVGFRIAVTF